MGISKKMRTFTPEHKKSSTIMTYIPTDAQNDIMQIFALQVSQAGFSRVAARIIASGYYIEVREKPVEVMGNGEMYLMGGFKGKLLKAWSNYNKTAGGTWIIRLGHNDISKL